MSDSYADSIIKSLTTLADKLNPAGAGALSEDASPYERLANALERLANDFPTTKGVTDGYVLTAKGGDDGGVAWESAS